VSDLEGQVQMPLLPFRVDSSPRHVRIFNTNNGELRYELAPDLRISTPSLTGKRKNIVDVERGQHVIR
jgi:hypothetical protein